MGLHQSGPSSISIVFKDLHWQSGPKIGAIIAEKGFFVKKRGSAGAPEIRYKKPSPDGSDKSPCCPITRKSLLLRKMQGCGPG